MLCVKLSDARHTKTFRKPTASVFRRPVWMEIAASPLSVQTAMETLLVWIQIIPASSPSMEHSSLATPDSDPTTNLLPLDWLETSLPSYCHLEAVTGQCCKVVRCGPANSVTTTLTTPHHGHTVAGCQDLVLDCASYGHSACTGTYKDWAQRNCPAFCNMCREYSLLEYWSVLRSF